MILLMLGVLSFSVCWALDRWSDVKPWDQPAVTRVLDQLDILAGIASRDLFWVPKDYGDVFIAL